MPRVTHVKRAQQRYATRPVIDPATGEQKKTPMINKRTGTQKVTKSGRPVFLRITERDTSKPKPLLVCDHCHKPIEIGTPYKHISPKSGPYGGRTLNRHAACPSWQVWEYSNSLGARLAQIQSAFAEDLAGAEDADAVTEALSAAAESIREIADEKRESASNIEDGFGHSTYQSEELEQLGDDLESWADEIENVSVPALEDYPCEECNGTGEVQCEVCDGDGLDDGEPCGECTGGVVDCDVCDDEEHVDKDAWREAVEGEVGIVEDQPF